MEKVINGVSCRVVEKEWDVYFDMALTMFEEIVKNNQAGKPSVFIVPVGPTDQYPILAKLINSQRVSLKTSTSSTWTSIWFLRPSGSARTTP